MTSNPEDDEIVLYLVNETGSWHGHTVLVAEGWQADGFGGGKRWYNTWSFEPDPNDPGSKAFGGLSGAIRAVLRVRHEDVEHGGDHHHLSKDREMGRTYTITRDQFKTLQKEIDEEKKRIATGKVKYVAIGHPLGLMIGILKWEYHDNCNSWINRVLRKAGIISVAWGATWYLPNVPKLSVKV